jgi:hypothetical protein
VVQIEIFLFLNPKLYAFIYALLKSGAFWGKYELKKNYLNLKFQNLSIFLLIRHSKIIMNPFLS